VNFFRFLKTHLETLHYNQIVEFEIEKKPLGFDFMQLNQSSCLPFSPSLLLITDNFKIMLNSKLARDIPGSAVNTIV